MNNRKTFPHITKEEEDEMRRVVWGIFCAVVAGISLWAAPSVQGVTGPAPGAVTKSPDFIITLPWGDTGYTALEAYGDEGNQGTDQQCCRNDFHALDFDVLPGQMILPVAAGAVIFAGSASGSWADMENAVLIDHGNGYQSFYGRLRTVSSDVYPGKRVETYMVLGTAGGVGAWKPFHFALYRGASFDVNAGPYGGRAVVPEPFANCIRDYERSCENFRTGSLLSKVTPLNMARDAIIPSWSSPASATQYHLQVTPLHEDGPGINLIRNVDSGIFWVLPPVFGYGNYVLLPGAHYSWTIRFSSAPHSIGVDDSSWGPWSTQKWYRTEPPSSSTLTLVEPTAGSVTTKPRPTLRWNDVAWTNFYYEVQLSTDPQFRMGSDAVAAVYWNLVHGGMTNPLNSWTVPEGFDLPPGTYYFRVRQRVQATLNGAEERGIPWAAPQSFTFAP